MYCLSLLGDRYGYRPLPARLPSTEYRLILRLCKKINSDNASLLMRSYAEDLNAHPSTFVLQVRYYYYS